jgi:uncharacterized membrane protein YfcA
MSIVRVIIGILCFVCAGIVIFLLVSASRHEHSEARGKILLLPLFFISAGIYMFARARQPAQPDIPPIQGSDEKKDTDDNAAS